MKKFRYRLERVLRFREIVKAEKKRLLGLARQELAAAEARLLALEQELLVDRIGTRTILTVDELQLSSAYTTWLSQEMERQKLHVEGCKERVAQALAAYVEATQEAESLIRHKSKKRTEYEEYLEREQQKFLDELTTQRIGRTKLSESEARRTESQLKEETAL